MPDNGFELRSWIFRIHRAASAVPFTRSFRIKIGVTRHLARMIMFSIDAGKVEVKEARDGRGRPTKRIEVWGVVVEWLDDGSGVVNR